MTGKYILGQNQVQQTGTRAVVEIETCMSGYKATGMKKIHNLPYLHRLSS
jgi:hypothetical protein